VAERAYSSRVHDHEIRIQEAGPLGRRVFSATRLEINWTDTAAHSAIEAPTIRVLDGFTRGGAQVRGGRRARDFELGSDVDYIRGIHSIRLGTLIEGGHYRSDDETNYLGTYTFNSVAAYEAGQPALFVRRIGSPIVDYWNVNSGAYIQDDIRLKKSLTFSPDSVMRCRRTCETRECEPRFGVTWAPFKSGRTTLRSSYGVFNNW
jgi:hypothetical protein